MLAFVTLALLCLTAADHWTTYLCLRAPVAGFHVSEANPIAAVLFQQVGLVPGLVVDGLLTLGALLFLVWTRRLPEAVKVLFLVTVAVWTGAAVANNLDVLAELGLSPFGARG